MNNKPTPNSHSTIELSIAQERLRQARYSFNLALTATALSASISLVGAGLLLLGKVREGTVTAAGGMAASVRCVQLAKDTNDRLDKILAELDDET
ncbi:MAG: TRADD-N-associated membrane domain-containing protein [Nostoc sp.]